MERGQRSFRLMCGLEDWGVGGGTRGFAKFDIVTVGFGEAFARFHGWTWFAAVDIPLELGC